MACRPLAAGCLLATLVACGSFREPSGDVADAISTDTAQGPLLENEEWTLLNMATAHGTLVIEVEAQQPERALEIAQVLVDPLEGAYADVLVYVYRRGDDSEVPARRIEWTQRLGYIDRDGHEEGIRDGDEQTPTLGSSTAEADGPPR